MISGINGSNLILDSSAKSRVAVGMIKYAKIEKIGNGYIVEFHSPSSGWSGNPLILCSAHEPHKARRFKNAPEALRQISEIGL